MKITPLKALGIGVAGYSGVVSVALWRFRKGGGTINSEALWGTILKPFDAFRVAFAGPSESDLDQTNQTTTSIF